MDNKRTPAAEAAIHRAQNRFYELADDPNACMVQFAPLFLSFVAPARRAEALLTMRELVHDPQGRLQMLIWAYQGALKLYNEGAFDEDVAQL